MKTPEKQLKRSQSRYYRLKEEGVCVNCGKWNAAPPHVTCISCYEKAKTHRKGTPQKPEEIEMNCHPITLTKNKYRTKDNRIGTISPCAGDDPIILKFPDGNIEVFHASDIKKI